jgi:hypothetical protein
MAKGRSISKISKELETLVDKMKKKAKEFAEADGAKKQKITNELKKMTFDKKMLEKELESSVAELDKNAQLQVDERVILSNAIKKIVEQEIKFFFPNRYTRRKLQKLTESTVVLESQAKRVAKSLKRGMSESQWTNLVNFVQPVMGVNEVGAVSDDVVAKAIAQIAKEATKGKVTVDPNKINVDALEDPKSIDSKDDVIDEGLLMEMGPLETGLLAAPTLLKFLGNIVDWIGGLTFGDEKSRSIRRIIGRMYEYAKKNKEIPSKADMVKQLGGTVKGMLQGVSFEADKKYIDDAYAYLGQTIEKSHKSDDHAVSFDSSGASAQPVDEHMLHVIHDASADTKLGKWLKNTAHEMHDAYLIPLRAVISGVMLLGDPSNFLRVKKVWETSKRVADVIYTIGMFFIAIDGGMHAIDQVVEALPEIKATASAAGQSGTIFTAVADSIKAGDMSVAILKGVLEKALA